MPVPAPASSYRDSGLVLTRFAVADRREERMDSAAGSGHRPAVVVGLPSTGGEPILLGGERRPDPAVTGHPGRGA